MKRQYVPIRGKSGQVYQFLPYALGTKFSDESALYVFAKRINSSYTILYIGETGELGTRMKNHEKMDKAIKLGCNCILVCRIDKDIRIDAETDLRHKYDTELNQQ